MKLNLNLNLNLTPFHSMHLAEASTGAAPLADELIHLRGIAADMVQSALATGEDVHQQFHAYLLDVRVDHLSCGDEADYELVTFRVQHNGEWLEQANYLRTIPHLRHPRVEAKHIQTESSTDTSLAHLEPHFVKPLRMM